MSLVTVLMSVYKETEDILSEAIESIQSQTLSDFTFIIVLDSPESLTQRNLLLEKGASDPRIIILENELNIGLANSLNRAILMADSPFVARMDADDVARPRRLEQQLLYLENCDCDLIGSYMSVISENGNTLYDVKSIPIENSSIRKALKYNNCMPHPTWFGKRDLFLQKYRNIPLCEDYDFLLRAVLSGAKLGNCPELLLNYRMTHNSISRSNLLLQFTYQKVLSSYYVRGEIASEYDIQKKAVSKYDASKEQAYSEANLLFNKGYAAMNDDFSLEAVKYFVKVPFVSLDYVRKIICMLRAHQH